EADDLSSAPPQMQEDPAVPKAEASPPPSVTSDETKREEVDKSLAKIRDFIEITLADAETHSPKDPIPPQTSAKLEEMSPSLPSVVQEEPVAQAKDQTEDPLSLEANAKALLERLPFGVLVTRGAVPIIMNQSLLDTLGYADIDAFYEAGGPDHIFEAKSSQSGHDQISSAIPVRRADGHILQLDVRLRMMQWGGDAATLMTFHPALETELVKKIRALEHESGKLQSESRELHAILDTATDGVIVLDAQGLILSLNQSAQALFGYDQGELLGQSFSTLLMPESHAYAQDYLAGLQGKGVASLLNDGREIIGRARQGGAIPIFMTIGRVASGDAMKFCAVLRDMTHWKKAESELREARREAERASALKSDFLAKISHEIRTPLHAILGFAEVIMEERFGPVGNDRYKDYLKDIHASGSHVMSLVNDLLDLSKIESGKAELNFVAVDANRIVQESVALLQPQALRERVILRVALAPQMPKLVADERSLKQIVLNLLSNAVKFNEPGGQVIVSTALTDTGNAVIRVKDTGIGMDDEEIQMALEPFRQLATARQSSGTGLGLPLTRALVEANRASFTIRSRKREGTLVEVSFPSPRVLAE
ncbi:MAG: PAS domain S-box protein, partial [Alphaproteobacteria bacterium]|nr:PAS domain S-box protein [Alphaproteobacteria bacterium]